MKRRIDELRRRKIIAVIGDMRPSGTFPSIPGDLIRIASMSDGIRKTTLTPIRRLIKKTNNEAVPAESLHTFSEGRNISISAAKQSRMRLAAVDGAIGM